MNLTDTQLATLAEMCGWKLYDGLVLTDGDGYYMGFKNQGLTLAGERVVIEKLGLDIDSNVIRQLETGQKVWRVWKLGIDAHSAPNLTDAINAALIDILEAREHE